MSGHVFQALKPYDVLQKRTRHQIVAINGVKKVFPLGYPKPQLSSREGAREAVQQHLAASIIYLQTLFRIIMSGAYSDKTTLALPDPIKFLCNVCEYILLEQSTTPDKTDVSLRVCHKCDDVLNYETKIYLRWNTRYLWHELSIIPANPLVC